MPLVKKICKVCGKEYEACRTLKPNFGTFRYQDVACCKEHGEIYLAQIIESRKEDSDGVRTDTIDEPNTDANCDAVAAEEPDDHCSDGSDNGTKPEEE